MSSAWDKWEKENNAFPVGQQADLHTKKKGAAKGAKTQKQADQAMQEQLAAAMIRETMHLALLRECLSKLDWIHMKFDDVVDIGIIERLREVV